MVLCQMKYPVWAFLITWFITMCKINYNEIQTSLSNPGDIVQVSEEWF